MEDLQGPRFTSSKCPPAAGLENTCQVPFGFCWTPLAENTDTGTQTNASDHTRITSSPTADQHLLLCLSCLAHFNLYTSVEEKPDGSQEWHCLWCGAENVWPTRNNTATGTNTENQPDEQDRLLQAYQTQSILQIEQPLSAAAALEHDTSNWILVLDEHLPVAQVQAIGHTVSDMLLQNFQQQCIHLGLIVMGRYTTLYQLRKTKEQGLVSAHVVPSDSDFVIAHEQDNEGEDGEQQPQEEEEEADTVYYQTMKSPEDVQVFWECLAAHYKFALPLDNKQERSENTKSSSSSSSSHRLQLLKERKLARQQREKESSNTFNDSSQPVTATVEPLTAWSDAATATPTTAGIFSGTSSLQHRATGHALHCAVELATRQPSARAARILLVTNGCPNFGPGSVVVPDENGGTALGRTHSTRNNHNHVDPRQLAFAQEYYDTLGETAATAGIGIDVLCTGALELAMPAYQSLVQASAGYALACGAEDSMNDDDGNVISSSTQQLQSNLQWLWNETHLSGLYRELHEHEETQDWLDGCLVDLRLSPCLEPVHVMGMGDFVHDTDAVLPTERAAFAAGAQRAAQQKYATAHLPVAQDISSTLTRIRLGRTDPLSTISVLLARRDNDDGENNKEPPQAVYVQCIVRYTTATKRVTKIATHRLSVAPHVTAFLDGIDEPVVAVLLAKEAVYRALYGHDDDGGTDSPDVDLSYQAQQDLDATVQNISQAFRLLGLQEGSSRGLDLTEEGQTRSAGTSLDFTFPPALSDAVRRLYHLRRGPLISPGPMQSEDDRAEKRGLFLRMPLDACLCMMAPSLWTIENGNLESVPPETLVLWDNVSGVCWRWSSLEFCMIHHA